MKVDWSPMGVITENIEKNMMDGLEDIAKLVAARARQLCPVGKTSRPATKGGEPWTKRTPGTLRDSIRVSRLKGDPKQDVRVYAGGRNPSNNEGYYAHMVEYGSVHNTPKKPFLRPAAREIKSAIPEIIAARGDLTKG